MRGRPRAFFGLGVSAVFLACKLKRGRPRPRGVAATGSVCSAGRLRRGRPRPVFLSVDEAISASFAGKLLRGRSWPVSSRASALRKKSRGQRAALLALMNKHTWHLGRAPTASLRRRGYCSCIRLLFRSNLGRTTTSTLGSLWLNGWSFRILAWATAFSLLSGLGRCHLNLD